MFCIHCFSSDLSDGRCLQCGVTQDEPNRDRRALATGALVAGKYLIGKVLGSGGFGITYLAQDRQLSRIVALKEFFPTGLVSRSSDRSSLVCNSADNEEPFKRGLSRFFREGKLLAKFDHPNVVRVFEVLEANGSAFLAMEYLEGTTLKAFLTAKGKLREAEALDVMTFVMDALKIVHEADVVHRDIKPDNIYITKQGRTLLLDFGGAKQLTAEGDRSMDAMFAHGYAAPEQYFANSDKVGPWTDVYACGALIYKLMTGQTVTSALDRYSEDLPLDWRSTDASQHVRDAVAKAMSLKSAERFQSIRAFQDALYTPPVQNKWKLPGLVSAAIALLAVLGWGGLRYVEWIKPKQEAVSSEPVRSEPVRSEPVRSEPVRSEPVRSEPVKPILQKSKVKPEPPSKAGKEPLADSY